MKELNNLHTLNNKKLLTILMVNKINEFSLNETCYSLTKQSFPVDLLVLHKDVDENKLKSILDAPKLRKTKQDDKGNAVEEIKEATDKINYVIESTPFDTFQKLFNEAFNYAVENKYEYFTIIEADDYLFDNWHQKFIEYSKDNTFDGYMPLSREISSAGFIGFLNEACWVEGLAEVAGTFDLNLMLRFNCMNVSGAIFKTESVKAYSQNVDGYYKPMKESIKINYIYEFFLRMVYNDLKFYTIPRIGYEKRMDAVLAEDINYFSSKIHKFVSTLPIDKGGVTQEEFKFWNDISKKEYFFDEDRETKYITKN